VDTAAAAALLMIYYHQKDRMQSVESIEPPANPGLEPERATRAAAKDHGAAARSAQPHRYSLNSSRA